MHIYYNINLWVLQKQIKPTLNQSAISPLVLSKLSDSCFLKVSIWSNEFGNVDDDDCSNDNVGLSGEE